MTWQLTVITIMLTLLVTVELGERGYVYYKAHDARQQVVGAYVDQCVAGAKLSDEGLTPAQKFKRDRAMHDACEEEYYERQR